MRTLVTAAVLAATLAGGRPARADGFYLSEGFGAATVGGELARFYDGGFTARVALGRHVGDWAFEATLAASTLTGAGLFGDHEFEAVSYGLEVKRLVHLTSWAQAYVRGGLNHMQIDQSLGNGALGDGYQGRGFDYGAGVQVSGELPVAGFLFSPLFFADWGPKISSALWLDLGREEVRVRHPRASTLDGELSTVTLGFTLGGQF